MTLFTFKHSSGVLLFRTSLPIIEVEFVTSRTLCDGGFIGMNSLWISSQLGMHMRSAWVHLLSAFGWRS